MSTFTTDTAPSTLLDAVNTLLRAIRVSGVMSLAASDLNEDAASAKAAIEDAVREALMVGYEFNTEWEYKIDPDPNGEIILPSNTLKVRSHRPETERLTKRGLKLYNNRKHTYAIGKTVTIDLVVSLPFEELPAGFKMYVTALAARRWCIPKLPTGVTFQYTEEYLQAALSRAEQEDTEGADTTLTDTSPHFAYMRRR